MGDDNGWWYFEVASLKGKNIFFVYPAEAV